MTADEFHARRDRRSAQVGALPEKLTIPITIRMSAATAATKAGQVCLLGIVDLLSRVHRHLDLQIGDATLVDGTSLIDAATSIALAINPYISLEPAPGSPSIGIGSGIDNCTWHVGGHRWQAQLSSDPIELTDDRTSVWGAMLGACLGSAAMFWQVHDQPLEPIGLSAWDLGDRDGPDLTGPLDVGNVDVIGAGAVSAALAYWLSIIGVVGHWTFVDGDLVELHNTNRTMGYTAADAGWPNQTGASKAACAARAVRAAHHEGWYDGWMATRPPRPDLIVCVANGGGVRHAVGQRQEPILLHASTSRNGTAELHRHLPEYDECIACRFPDPGEPVFECSTAPLPTDHGTSDDAALPFLSATAGLLLLVALVQLPDGPLITSHPNHWCVHLAGGPVAIQAQHWNCGKGCASTQSPEIREQINQGRRWAHLDRSTRTRPCSD